MAVDVGNSRIKLGDFALPAAGALPHPRHSVTLDFDWSGAELEQHLPPGAKDFPWSIASVNRPAANRLLEWLRERGIAQVRLLSHADMPIEIDVTHPDRVGLDRLADAVAANRLREPHRPAIVVDHGSALTVNLISARGVFLGGAILPGIRMSARALHEFTDRLPEVEVADAPEVLERSTEGAIRFGLFWGAVGAVREVVARLTPPGSEPQVFLTGGAAPALAAVLDDGGRLRPQFVPHLTLAGIAVAAIHAAAPRAL
jgi:type III pantothenate kinase